MVTTPRFLSLSRGAITETPALFLALTCVCGVCVCVCERAKIYEVVAVG